MNKVLTCTIIFSFFIFSCVKDTSTDSLDLELKKAVESAAGNGHVSYYIFPDSDDYIHLPNQEPANPVTKAKVELGNLLFFETGLAQIPEQPNCYETYSCSSCHIPTAGFLPGRIQGIADGAGGYGYNGEMRYVRAGYDDTDLDAQGTRPMNPMNSGYSTNTLWSGAFGATGVNKGTEENWTGIAEVNHTGYMGLEAQNIEAFSLHRLDINDHVLDDYGYRELYDKAFPEFKEEERYSDVTTSFALGCFLRSFLANEAPFQYWLKGDYAALTESQKEGALLFFGKARCSSCHAGPALNSMSFHALGTADMYTMGGLNTGPDDPRNLGRGMFTGNEEDNYKFKVPQLYNVKEYSNYFHGSSKSSLEEVLDFKVTAKSENPFISDYELSPYFRPVDLTEKEISQLIDFLSNGLYDSKMLRYVPESLPSGNCFPNNDPISREQLGCD